MSITCPSCEAKMGVITELGIAICENPQCGYRIDGVGHEPSRNSWEELIHPSIQPSTFEGLSYVEGLRIVDSLPKTECENCIFEHDTCKVLENYKKIDKSWDQEDLSFEEIEKKEKEEKAAIEEAKNHCRRDLFYAFNISIEDIEDFVETTTVSNRNEQVGETNYVSRSEEIKRVPGKEERLVEKIKLLLSNLIVERKEGSLNKFSVKLGEKMVAELAIRDLNKDPNKVAIGPCWAWDYVKGKKIETFYTVRGPIEIPKEEGDVEVRIMQNDRSRWFVTTLELITEEDYIYKYNLLFGYEQMKLFVFYNSNKNWFRPWGRPSFQQSQKPWVVPNQTKR